MGRVPRPRGTSVHQRDYILRLIEQLGGALVALRRGFSEDTLHMFVSPTGEVEPARCWLMAELLYLDGLQAKLEERGDDARSGLLADYPRRRWANFCRNFATLGPTTN